MKASLYRPACAGFKSSVRSFDPERNAVHLKTDETVTYDYLVVCTGINLDWHKISGLSETLGKNGVCSNYSPAYVDYTWHCLQQLKAGDRAVFTQPPLPFKCPGAPQKIAYLAADYLKRRGILSKCKLDFYSHAPVIFGVPFFARELLKVMSRYNIGTHYQHNLVAVDAAAKTATFEKVDDQNKGERVVVAFDMLHVSPPQSSPDEIKSSPLANGAGWVEVNQNSMQHVRYSNVFALGDVASSPNSKTAAAVRKQAPVVVDNLLRSMRKTPVEAAYDGYASCPLTTGNGKTIFRRIHLWRQSHPDTSTQPSQRALDGLVDKGQRPAADVLALYAQRLRVVSQAQYCV